MDVIVFVNSDRIKRTGDYNRKLNQIYNIAL